MHRCIWTYFFAKKHSENDSCTNLSSLFKISQVSSQRVTLVHIGHYFRFIKLYSVSSWKNNLILICILQPKVITKFRLLSLHPFGQCINKSYQQNLQKNVYEAKVLPAESAKKCTFRSKNQKSYQQNLKENLYWARKS